MTPLLAATTFETIVDVIKFFGACGTVLALALLILLSLPKSRLRAVLLELVSWLGCALCAVYAISPLDVIPDIIPVAGIVDDVGAVGAGIFAFITAMRARRERRELAC